MTDVAEEPHAPVKVGDIVSLHIEGLAAGGDFVGRLGPFAVFVTGAAPSVSALVALARA